jgi:predicted DNA binding CopG/RHH family protein
VRCHYVESFARPALRLDIPQSDVNTSLRQPFKTMPKADTKKKDKRKNTSLRLESETLKALKIYAIKKDTSVQKIVEKLVQDYLKGKK